MGDGGDELFGEFHHRRVVDIGFVELERSEFRIVPRRKTLVPETAIDLEQLVGEAANQEPLQMQLGRDPQIEIDVERIMMRHEWLC